MNQIKRINLKQERTFWMLFFMLGVALNYIVMSANGFMMPVQTTYTFNDGKHFAFQDKEDVKFYRLSDIIGGEYFNHIIKISLGDIIMIVSATLIILKQLGIIMIEKKIRREEITTK